MIPPGMVFVPPSALWAPKIARFMARMSSLMGPALGTLDGSSQLMILGPCGFTAWMNSALLGA